MKVTQVLLILFFIQGGVHSDDDLYCTEQPDSIRVEKGGSVDIPCHFSYPKKNRTPQVKVYWRSARNGRCGNSEFIYNHTENLTHENYTERISMEETLEMERKATLKIKELKGTDGPMFCCRIELLYDGNIQEKWQNKPGTYIKFKDQFSVEQPDVVPAVMGEDISIPCAIHNKSPDVIDEIIWRTGTNDLCSENKEFIRWNQLNITQKVGRWTIQKFNDRFLLHIASVKVSDSLQYCCEVITELRSAERQSSAHGTQVVTTGSAQKFKFKVTQSETISANEGDSVTISCSYTVPSDQNLLWHGVFWRVGSQTGPYAYHPSDLMVHPSYSGRTQLSGLANLQIKGIQDTDNTTYYCFVMLKFCTGNSKTDSVLQYGIGTQLTINGTNQNPAGPPTHPTETSTRRLTVSSPAPEGLDLQQLSGILAGVAVLLVLIVLCAVLICLKKKGVICKKKDSAKSSPAAMNNAPSAPRNDANVEMSNVRASNTATSQENVEGTVYAHLNMEALKQGAGKRKNPSSSDNQVLYAAVKPVNPTTSDDQVIYSAIR